MRLYCPYCPCCLFRYGTAIYFFSPDFSKKYHRALVLHPQAWSCPKRGKRGLWPCRWRLSRPDLSKSGCAAPCWGTCPLGRPTPPRYSTTARIAPLPNHFPRTGPFGPGWPYDPASGRSRASCPSSTRGTHRCGYARPPLDPWASPRRHLPRSTAAVLRRQRRPAPCLLSGWRRGCPRWDTRAGGCRTLSCLSRLFAYLPCVSVSAAVPHSCWDAPWGDSTPRF